jgi:hypothetical protein
MTETRHWGAIFGQLVGSQKPSGQPRANPRPPGTMWCQSSSHQIYELMKSRPTEKFTHGRLMYLTGKTRNGVNSGLLFLRINGYVEVFTSSENPRYLLYRFLPDRDAPPVAGSAIKRTTEAA